MHSKALLACPQEVSLLVKPRFKPNTRLPLDHLVCNTNEKAATLGEEYTFSKALQECVSCVCTEICPYQQGSLQRLYIKLLDAAHGL